MVEFDSHKALDLLPMAISKPRIRKHLDHRQVLTNFLYILLEFWCNLKGYWIWFECFN